jgi:hypothetical protein
MFNKLIYKQMKSILSIRKAIYLAVCMTFALTLFSGCEGEGKDVRDAFVGSYRVTERIIGTGEIDYYDVSVVKSAVNNEDVLMSNFFNDSAITLRMTVSSNGTSFTIPQQTFGVLGFSGSGRREGNTLSYSVLANMTGGLTLNLDVTALKQ